MLVMILGAVLLSMNVVVFSSMENAAGKAATPFFFVAAVMMWVAVLFVV